MNVLLHLLFLSSVQKLSCQWQKTGQFVLESMVRNLAWHPTGTFTHKSVTMLEFRVSFLKILNQLFKSYLQLVDIYFLLRTKTERIKKRYIPTFNKLEYYQKVDFISII